MQDKNMSSSSVQQFPIQLTQDYEDNEEWKYIAYIKLGFRVSKSIDSYRHVFCQQLLKECGQKRKALIQFLTLMVELQYITLTNNTIYQVFTILGNIAKQKNQSCPEFQLVSLMMSTQSLQSFFLSSFMAFFRNQHQHQPNFSLRVLQKILSNTNEIMEGRRKGPNIKIQSITRLCQQSFMMTQVRHTDTFINLKDHENYLLISALALKIYTKYGNSQINFPDANLLTDIWVSRIRMQPSSLTPKIVDALFCVMAQLFNYPSTNMLQNIEQELIFSRIIQFSSSFALKCQNVNKLWSTYLTKKKNISKFFDVKSFQIMQFCCYCLQQMTYQIKQVTQKLTIVDNMILLNSMVAKIYQYDSLTSQNKNLNPQLIDNSLLQPQQLFQLALQALYSPVFAVKSDNKILFNVITQMQRVSSLHEQQSFIHTQQIKQQLLNMLPALKILVIKFSTILSQSDCLSSLVHFLFLFLLDQQHGPYFQNFIQLICKLLKIQMRKPNTNHIVSTLREIIKTEMIQINKCLTKSTIGERSAIYIKSFVRSISQFIELVKQRQTNTVPYLAWLLQILDKRIHLLDEDLQKVLSKNIKQLKGTQRDIVGCLDRIYSIVGKSNKYFYSQLIFDFAQSHNSLPQVVNFMKNKNFGIRNLCKSSPVIDQSIRNISYNVMMQNVYQGIDTSYQIVQDLQYIIVNHSLRSKILERIYQIIQKQRAVLLKFQHDYQKIVGLSGKFIKLMILLMRRLNDTIEQTITMSKLQRAQMCYKVSQQILQYTTIITRYVSKYHIQFDCSKIVHDTQTFINNNKFRLLLPFQKAMKYLMASYLQLQGKTNNQKNEKIYLQDEQMLQFKKQYSGVKNIMKKFGLDGDQPNYVKFSPADEWLCEGFMIKFFGTEFPSNFSSRIRHFN